VSRVNRRKAKVDEGQKEAVDFLRNCGFSVRTGVDDFYVGHGGVNLWVEWKGPEAVSKRTGEILESHIEDDQRTLRDTWKGVYMITSKVEDITEFFGIKFK
jgi:hypothetical protein